MDQMLGHKLVIAQCQYGCCKILTNKRTVKRREEREWKKEVRDDR